MIVSFCDLSKCSTNFDAEFEKYSLKNFLDVKCKTSIFSLLIFDMFWTFSVDFFDCINNKSFKKLSLEYPFLNLGSTINNLVESEY